MKKLFVLSFCLLGMFFVSASLVEAAEFGAFFKPGYMVEWTEKFPNSRRNPFVEERGLLYAVGANNLFFLTEDLSLKSEGEISWGQLDYRGSSMSSMTDYNTTGSRMGFTVEETASYKIKINESFSLSPSASLGFSYWHREVCAENWYTAYARLGIKVESGLFFGKIGALLPFYTEVEGGIKDVPWLNNGRETRFSIKPKGVPTPFAEIGIRYKKTTLSFLYELRKWEESDRVGMIFQPETSQQTISIKLEYHF